MHFVMLGALGDGSGSEVRPASLRPVMIPELVKIVLSTDDYGREVIANDPVKLGLANYAVTEKRRTMPIRVGLRGRHSGTDDDAIEVLGVWKPSLTCKPVVCISEGILSEENRPSSIAPKRRSFPVIAPEYVSANLGIGLEVGLYRPSYNNRTFFLGEITTQRSNLIFQGLRLLLGDLQLLLSRNRGFRGVSPSLSGRNIQKISLARHLLELQPKDNSSSDNCDERSSYDNDIQARPAERQLLKYAKSFTAAIAAWIVGWFGCDVILGAGSFGRSVERWLQYRRGRSLSETERVLLGALGILGAALLAVQAILIVTQKYLTPHISVIQ